MKNYNELIEQLNKLDTEKVNQNSINIDQLSSIEITEMINNEDNTVASVVKKSLPEISKTAELFATTYKNGGRIFYIGAGTSGRLGVLDAAECPPTFGTNPDKIIGVISGGYDTLILSEEGVEDNINAAIADLTKHQISDKDMIIGIAASCRTPYTLSGLEFAQNQNCKTTLIICNKPDEIYLKKDVIQNLDCLISVPVGPEIITGSTRMKSGTAQKMVLNLISTTAMVLMGKTYGNLMVDLQAKSDKLVARSRKILMEMFEISIEQASELLDQSNGSVKTAIVMKKFNCSKSEAENKLKSADGFITKIK